MTGIAASQAEGGHPPAEHIEAAAINAIARAGSGEAGRKATESLLAIALEQCGAERGLLLVVRGDELRTEAEVRAFGKTVEVVLRVRALDAPDAPESILRDVVRTAEEVLLDDACSEPNP